MPQNRILYAGVVIVVATALVWVGAELTKRIEWLLPYAAALGVILLVAGVAQVLIQKRRGGGASSDKP